SERGDGMQRSSQLPIDAKRRQVAAPQSNSAGNSDRQKSLLRAIQFARRRLRSGRLTGLEPKNKRTARLMVPTIKSVLHPTDFSEGSRVAFHHALKAAILAKAKLTLFNVSADGAGDWADFPGVRETLERWGLLPPGSPRSAVGEQLGIAARK